MTEDRESLPPSQTKILLAFCWLAAAAWYAFFLLHRIDFITADLGRHLKNGEELVRHSHLVSTNAYSYTYPDFPVVNHHWGGGVLFYWIWTLSGFPGLSVFFALLSLATFSLFFDVARKESGTGAAFVAALAAIPLMTERLEVRPEALSYFFCALFFWLLWEHRRGRLSRRSLWLLPLIEIAWVNCHIYFVFGPLLIGAFLFEEGLRRGDSLRTRAALLLGACAAALVNPSTLAGALEPFRIFQNFGYSVAEAKSVWVMHRIIRDPNLLYVQAFFALNVLLIAASSRNLGLKKTPWALYGVTGLFGLMALFSIRNITLFAYFAVPATAYAFSTAVPELKKRLLDAPKVVLPLAALLWFGTLHTHRLLIRRARSTFGVGLDAGNPASAEFFIREGIRGPLFNNYDIGGYLIYYLAGRAPVFVDNRPEAYPASFFQTVYTPMQQSEEIWRAQNEKYRFNAIFYYYHDLAPWAEGFLTRRLFDDQWAPVFFDDYALILLRRDAENEAVISRFRIPMSRFYEPPRRAL